MSTTAAISSTASSVASMPSSSAPPAVMVAYPKILVYQGRKYPFNPHSIIFSEPQRTSHGGFVVKQTYQLRDEQAGINEVVPILLQTPLMLTTFGLSEKEHDGKLKAQIDLHFGT